MHPVSQILERNLPRLKACDSALWINPERDGIWRQLKDVCISLNLFSQDHGTFDFLQGSGADAEFGAFPQPGTVKYNWIVVNLPRQKALTRMLLDCAASLLSADGVLWLAGENKAGIKSANKLLKLHFTRVSKLDNARHCVLYEARGIPGKPTFNPAKYRQEWPLAHKFPGIKIISYPGVFAHGRLDAGTALLLDTLAGLNLQGDVLDFACGAGIVGGYIAATNPQTRVTLLDSNALALKACEETLAVNHLRGKVLASDGLSALEGQFDVIVSNPPIHSGVKTDNRLSLRLFESVHKHLKPGGELALVANIHLPYESWLAERFKCSRELSRNKNYKVILSKK